MPVVLVTGAGGLVGQHVMRSLTQLLTIKPVGVVRTPSAGASNWKHEVVDLAIGRECEALAALSPAVIVHAAAALPKFLDDEHAAETNTQIDTNIVNLVNASGAGVIFVSSTSVYTGSKLPWTETSEIGRLPSYAASKYATENKLQQLGADSAILRISSPYSAVDHTRQGVLYRFVRQAVAGKDLIVLGAGDRTQDFIHAQDIAYAVRLAVARMLSEDSPMPSGVFNIVNGVSISMRSLAEKIVDICGAGRVVYSNEDSQADFYRAELSRERAEVDLAWKPCVQIDLGIAQLARRMRGCHEDWLVV